MDVRVDELADPADQHDVCGSRSPGSAERNRGAHHESDDEPSHAGGEKRLRRTVPDGRAERIANAPSAVSAGSGHSSPATIPAKPAISSELDAMCAPACREPAPQIGRTDTPMTRIVN